MYIDTHTRKTMEQSIFKYFGITSEDLNALFYQISHEAQNEKYFDGYKFSEIVDAFIGSHHTSEVIDEILFFHLARRLNTALDDCMGYNLRDLLTKENVLSSFLKHFDVEFYIDGEHIEVTYKGNRVIFDDICQENVPYLRARLGYNKGREDYCFNGFALKDLLYRNSYARELEDVPEFIGILATFLNKRKIEIDYYQNSSYYCYEYRVPIERVMFDNNDKLSLSEKERYLLHQVLNRLYNYTEYDIRYMFDHDNPILRLADTDTMDIEFFVSKEKITNDMLKY